MASKTITRKEFLRLGASIVGVGSVMVTFGCPGDDDTDDTESSGSHHHHSSGHDSSGHHSSGHDSSGHGSSGHSSHHEDSTVDDTATGNNGSSSGGEGACTTDVEGTIGNNHGHALTLPLADIMAGGMQSYDIQGDSPHPHDVTLSADDFASLQAGDTVEVESTDGGGHTHMVTVRCA